MRYRAFSPLAALVLLAAACGSSLQAPATSAPTASAGPTQTPSPGPPASSANLFANGGFEEGRDPWFSLNPPDFVLAAAVAHTGKASALLQMHAGPEDQGSKVYYLVQEVNPEEFPAVISGYYRVAKWTRGTPLQYLQFAVIVFGAGNLPGGYPNHQIRYLLAGIDREPFPIGNARFVFLSRADPPLDQWVPFQVNVRDDFQRFWGAVPKAYQRIRVLFEVRYDGKAVGEGPAEAAVYYDDLYFGPAP